MRVRLRPRYTDEELMKIYDHSYDHTKWDEHVNRIDWTIRRLNHFIALNSDIKRVVDLSCGDGAILNGLSSETPLEKEYGDLVNADHLTIAAVPAEVSVKYIAGDLLVCSETLEHLDDPDLFLAQARQNFRYIMLSTPLGETDPYKNWEHYWGWDTLGIGEMLTATTWRPLLMETLNLPYYTYQLWIAR